MQLQMPVTFCHFKFVYFKSLVFSVSCFICSLAVLVCGFSFSGVSLPVLVIVFPSSSCVAPVAITPAFPVSLYNPLCSLWRSSVRYSFLHVVIYGLSCPAVSPASASGSSVFPVRLVSVLTLRLSPVSVYVLFCLVKDSVLY